MAASTPIFRNGMQRRSSRWLLERLISRLRFHVSVSTSSIFRDAVKIPALGTRMSSPPNRRTVSSTAAFTASSSVMSHCIPTRSSRSNRLEISGFRSSPATAAPDAWSISAQARPIPLAAPVTSAILPQNGLTGAERFNFARWRGQNSMSKTCFSDSPSHPPNASPT